jgi:hexosaminidase
MLERLVSSSDITAVRTLADVVQGPPEYQREELHMKATGHDYNSQESFNRLVDTSHPESIVAVHFGMWVEDLLAHKATPAETEGMRQALIAWRDNDVKLRHEIEGSSLLKDAAPLSENLSTVATVGLQALQHIEAGTHPTSDWTKQQLAVMNQAKQSHAELLLAVVPAVEKLVKAAGASH